MWTRLDKSTIRSTRWGRSHRRPLGLATGLLALTFALAIVSCGANSEGSPTSDTNMPQRLDASSPDRVASCPSGQALIARVRELENQGSDTAIQRFIQAVQAGPNTTIETAGGQRSGCASFQTLSEEQTETYVDLLYNGRSELAAALVFRQTPAARQAILDAYRANPDAVTSSPNLAAALAMAQIRSGQSYESAYGDLAFAALHGGIAPRYVRGYLAHFGCGYENAVWAARTEKIEDFLPGDAFPDSTSPTDVDRDELISDRMALLESGDPPALRSDCPLSDQYAADHNGDAMTRFKLQAKEWADKVNDRIGDYVDKLKGDDESATDDPDNDDGDPSQPQALRKRTGDDYSRFIDDALQASQSAGARLKSCQSRLNDGWHAMVDCFKDNPADDSNTTVQR